ncbi:tigger transposable element-derived protein 6 [Trichonephila clavipes]|nr:tigger transposable element-derived protein 6 [Trichonephila clavipes]
MPDKSFVFKNETCHGGKLSKERLTVLACTNATGTHKIKLVVIGKSRSPRCFKNVRSLPCNYLSQARSWMTGDLFKNWIHQLDAIFDEPNTTDNIISNITETEEILQNFPDYAAVDDALITSSTRTLGDIIADSLSLTTSDPVGSEREKSDSRRRGRPFTNSFSFCWVANRG